MADPRRGPPCRTNPSFALPSSSASSPSSRRGRLWPRAVAARSADGGAGRAISRSSRWIRRWSACSFPSLPSASASLDRGTRLGPAEHARPAGLARGRAGRSRPRSGDLSAARAFPCRAGAVAPSSHASRRPRRGRDHGRTLPPGRDADVDGDQAWDHRRTGRAGGGRAGVRGASQCDVDVQSWQRPLARSPRRDAAVARRDARHAPRPPLRSCRTRPTATSDSTCRGGTVFSEPTAPGRRPVTKP